MAFKKGDPVQTPDGIARVLKEPEPFPNDEVWVTAYNETYPEGVDRYYAEKNLTLLVPDKNPGRVRERVEKAMYQYMETHEKWGKRLRKHTKGTPIVNDLSVVIAKELSKL